MLRRGLQGGEEGRASAEGSAGEEEPLGRWWPWWRKGGEQGWGRRRGWTADHSTAKNKGPAAPGEGGASGKWGHLGLSGHPHLDQPECSEVWVDLLERGEMKRYF